MELVVTAHCRRHLVSDAGCVVCDEPWVPAAMGGHIRPIACGRCLGCRLEYSRQWAVRCIHESAFHERNCFVTLTYADAPVDLQYVDFRLFMRRLRRVFPKCSFYMSGEYGEKNGRPHFHAVLFGVDFDDKVSLGKGASGSQLFESETLSQLWGFGFASVGALTFESAGYVARYVHKKMISGGGVYAGSVGEFSRMSLRPAIGRRWLDNFGRSDVLPDGSVVVNGHKATAPRYYRRELKKRFPFKYKDLMYPDIELRDNREISADVSIRAASMRRHKGGLSEE